jgi:prolipoprotein diacylglyceryltransferase
MFVYPHPDKIAFAIGPFDVPGLGTVGPLAVHWYGIMYLVGFVAGWWLARRRAAGPGSTWTPELVDDLIFMCALGVYSSTPNFDRPRCGRIVSSTVISASL